MTQLELPVTESLERDIDIKTAEPSAPKKVTILGETIIPDNLDASSDELNNKNDDEKDDGFRVVGTRKSSSGRTIFPRKLQQHK